MGIGTLGNSSVLPLCVSSSDQESTGSIDLGVTDKLWPVGEFVHTESTNKE